MASNEDITGLLRRAGVVEAALPFSDGSMRILKRLVGLVKDDERAACIADVRTIGGSFAVECEDLIMQRRGNHD